ncbi:hypothetical protein [Acidovorax sp.]|uniref:hypothetical protein n=1 Tax=Acidovorax sp. TaxID=1872122 RepID=UPI0031E10D31
MSEAEAKASVDAAILATILPQLYIVIDDLLDHAQGAPKELIIRAKKLLPDYCPQSFAQSGI